MTEYICVIICISILACCCLFVACMLCLTSVVCSYKEYFIQEMSKKSKADTMKKIKWFKNVNEDSTRQENTEED